VSPQTRELIEVLLSLAPWILFLGAIAWSLVYQLREELREPHPGWDTQRRRTRDAAAREDERTAAVTEPTDLSES
jgi:hypothetical protein